VRHRLTFFFPQVSLDGDPKLPIVAGMTDMSHYAQIFLMGGGLTNFFFNCSG
jgi:hypothetical protein